MEDSHILDSLSTEFAHAQHMFGHSELTGILGPPKSFSFESGTREGNEKPPDEEKGEICEVKELYASQRSICSCCKDWLEEKPFKENKQQEKEKAETKFATFAINALKEPHGGENGWKIVAVVIHSSRIQTALGKVFRGYPVTYAVDFKPVLKPNFVPFYHRWSKLLEAERDEQDVQTKRHIILLRTLLEAELTEDFHRLDVVKQTGNVEFGDLEYLLCPGEIMIQTVGDDMQAGVLREIDLIKPPDSKGYYNLNMDVVDWNGTEFGINEVSWQVFYFKGSKQFNSLRVLPLQLHTNSEDIRQRLVRRGRKFEELCGQHFKAYSGIVAGIYSWVPRNQINERIMIDAEGFYKLEGQVPPSLQPFQKTGDPATSVGCPGSAVSDVEKGENLPMQSKVCASLTENQRLLAVPSVMGFALLSRHWCRFRVEAIREIVWDDEALGKLVLDEDEKSLIVALLDKNSQLDDFDDFISGKGVGKTVTAESVSEHLKRPLYRLGMTDLCTSGSEVEENLKTALDRCSRWNAVLLIDEADVFLEKRSVDSLQRNELVAKYYEGVMILTTNRTTSIDTAFESRIDVTLAYQDLTKDARAAVWRNFISGLGTRSMLGEDDIRVVAEYPLNGRQIKSALKTASIMASSQRRPIDLHHLEIVINLRNKAMRTLGQ